MWQLTYVWPELRHLTHLKFDGGTTTVLRNNLGDIKKIADEQGLPYTDIKYQNKEGKWINYTLGESDRAVEAIREIQSVMDKWGVEVIFYPDGGYYAFRVDDKEFCRKDFGLRRDCLREG